MNWPRRLLAWTIAIIACSLVVVAIQRSNYIRNEGTPDLQISSSPQIVNVLFVGDSYSAGVGASSPDNSWVQLVSRYENWNPINVAVGGTGYMASPVGRACSLPVCPNFAESISHAATKDVGLVVISGGRNDVGEPPTMVDGAISHTLELAVEKYGRERVIVTSPIWDSRQSPSKLTDIIDQVHREAVNLGIDYVDLDLPLRGRPGYISDDGIHPNDAGHAAIADSFIVHARQFRLP